MIDKIYLELNPGMKKILAFLQRFNIEKYIITSDFENVCLENDINKQWKDALKYVYKRSTVAVLIPGYTGDAKKAFSLFLSDIGNRNDFLYILDNILIDFIGWKAIRIDFNPLKDILIESGFEETQINNMQIFKIIYADENDFKIPNFKGEFSLKNNCFCLMPFNENFDAIYNQVLRKAINDSGLDPLRADEIFGNESIINDIIENIKSSKMILADLTGRNPNVFYEVGLAHAWNKEVILMSQNTEDIPFDLRHLRYIKYQDSVAGSEILKEHITKTILAVLNKK